MTMINEKVDIEEVLEPEYFPLLKFKSYVKYKGLHQVTVEDLNLIVEKFGIDVFQSAAFNDVFNYITTEKTNREMRRWTIIIGVLTIFITVMTGVMMTISILDYREQANMPSQNEQKQSQKTE